MSALPVPEFQHFLLTRFNVRLTFDLPPEPQQPVHPGIDAAWLTHRFDLFERFCLPSVLGQTSDRFQWLLFLDAETPDPFRRRMDALAAEHAIHPVYIDQFSYDLVKAVVLEQVQPGVTHLITTRMDNDDAISRSFVETVHAHFLGQEMTFLNFLYGYSWHKGKIYFHRQRSNPFISLIEKVESARTVFCGDHRELDAIGDIIQIISPAGWRQVINRPSP